MLPRLFAVLPFTMAALTTGRAGADTPGDGSGAYDVLYSAFVQELRSSQINLASVNGISYREQCDEYLGLDLLTGNVSEADSADYLKACEDAHTGVFGYDENS